MRAEKLRTINLSKNNIGPDGCLALTKANWTKLSTIDLSNYVEIKRIIKLETKDASIC